MSDWNNNNNLEINQDQSDSEKEDDENNSEKDDEKIRLKGASGSNMVNKKPKRPSDAFDGLTSLVNYVLPHTFRSFENARSINIRK